MSAAEPTSAGGDTGAGGKPPGTERVRAPVLALLVILIGLGITAAVMRMGGSGGPDAADVNLSVPDWRVQPTEQASLAAVAAERRRHLPKDLDDPAIKRVLDAYAAFNAAHKRHKGRRLSAGLRDAHANLEQLAVELARYRGAELYMALGEHIADRYLAALDARDAAAMERWAGTYLADCRATGLVIGQDRLAPGARPVMRAGIMATWASFVGSLTPGDALLASEERLLLARWKLAANPLVEAPRRAVIESELRRLGSDYPALEARAARAASERRWDEASRLYARAAREAPDDARLAANAAFCEARAAQRAQAGQRQQAPRP